MSIVWSFPGAEPVEYYELWWKPYYETQFLQLATTPENSRDINNVHAGKDYQFKVRARNNCGEGVFSPTATLSIPETTIVPEEPCHHCGHQVEPPIPQAPPREPEPIV
jgi:hypothetical protein